MVPGGCQVRGEAPFTVRDGGFAVVTSSAGGDSW